MKTGITLSLIGASAIAGNIFLITKWPVVVSIFFTLVKIYTDLSAFAHQFFS